nr:MAG TPA: tail protein [Caudoviricetes sp.]
MRKINYKFVAVVPNYEERKAIENVIKREVMMADFSKLYDSHDKEGYWYAKCESVDVDDIHEKNEIAVSVSFIARPFFIVDSDAKQDLWNDMWYPDKYEQKLSFTVEYKKTIHIWNSYDKAISPIINFSGNSGSIKYLNQDFPLTKGRNEFFDFQLLKGVNELELIGNGTFSFRLLGEVMM